MKEVANQASIDARPNHGQRPEIQVAVSREKEFLERAEALRLQQEWTHDLDLRRFVSEPRKRFRYRRRVFWLDADSRKLFLEGLERDGGVFTVAACDSILDGVRSKADQSLPQLPVSASVVPASLTAKLRAEGTTVKTLHEVLKLDYFEKRRKDRIKYTTRALLIGAGPILPGRTRDISVTGIKVRTSSTGGLLEGDVVMVKFPDIPEIEDKLVRYRVIRVVQKLNVFSFSLRREEGNSSQVIASLRRLIDHQDDRDGGQLRLDAEDALLTAESLLAERYYMHSSASIPFFVSRDGLYGAKLAMILYNKGNEEPLIAFQTETGGNDLAETISRRHLHHFMKLAKVDGQVLATLAVWRASGGGNLETCMDLSCRTDADWYTTLARYRHEDEFRAFKVIVRRVRRPSGNRLVRELEPLGAISPADARQLLGDGARIDAVGALLDCTSEIRTWNLTPYASGSPKDILQAVDGRESRGRSTPELLPVDYIEKARSNDRYLSRVHVTLHLQGKIIEAVTTDISLTGMSLSLPQGTPPVALGGSARVTLTGLTEQAGILARLRKTLEDVSYEVVSMEIGKEPLLRLRLQEPDRQKGFTEALSGLLQNKQSLLHVERSNSVQAAASRLYSSFFVAASTGIPLLYFHSQTNGPPSAKVGLTLKPGPLAVFFETADGRFDFSAITSTARTSRLWDELRQRGCGEMDVFLLKERIPDQPRYKISALADFEFADRKERGEFLDYAVGRDLRIVRIVMLPARIPSSPELEVVFKRLAKYSERRAVKLREDFEKIVAVGDAVDITTYFQDLRYIAP